MKPTCDERCKFWTYDMDGIFCVHPKSLEISNGWGASTNRMSVEGYCKTDEYGNKPDIAYALFEEKV